MSWLSNANNLVTTLGAGVAAVAAIFSTINKNKIEDINQKIAALDVKSKEFDFDQKKAKAINDFAALFLDKVLANAAFNGSDKHKQALLSILDIVAQASGRADDPDAKARAVMPLQLALLFNEPGALAAMDNDCKHLEAWVAMACADNSNKTRVTAIQALVGICQRALREGRLELLSSGIQSIDQLIAFIPPDQVAELGAATASRSQLASSLQRDERHLAKAQLPKGDTGNAKEIRQQISALMENQNETLLAAQRSVDAQVATLGAGTGNPQFDELKKIQSQLGAARAAALQVAVEKVTQSTGQPEAIAEQANNNNLDPFAVQNGQPDQSADADEPSNPDQQALNKLIANMASKDDQTRHKARSDAALFGQKAVKPLLREVSKRFGKKGDEDYKTRLGVAVALKLMPQPVVIETTDAYWVASLLQSTDTETRTAAADFLMGLDDASSVRNCFDEMEKVFYMWCESPNDKVGGNTVKTVATVVATWASRVITQDNPSREADKTFPQFALAQAEDWKKRLETGKAKADWGQTIAALSELINRAKNKKAL